MCFIFLGMNTSEHTSEQLNDVQPLSSKAWFLWAKSAPNDGGYTPEQTAEQTKATYLPLITHLLDVAACAWEILAREPERSRQLFARDFGLSHDPDQALRWVAALVGLHDLGKASPAFQCMWQIPAQFLPDKSEYLSVQQVKYVPHGAISQSALNRILKCKTTCNRSATLSLAQAVACHHGNFIKGLKPNKEQDGSNSSNRIWEQVREELFSSIVNAIKIRDTKSLALFGFSSSAFMRLAGLTSFSDWIGSSFSIPDVIDPLARENPAAYFDKARGKARKKLDEIGWTPREPLQKRVQSPAEMFHYIKNFEPRALQTQLAQTLIDVENAHQNTQDILRDSGKSDDSSGEALNPMLILIEAPMGEGKTEAGFHASTWLQSKVGHRGLYIALPTQATGNAMYTRFSEFLRKVQKDREIIPDLQLLHGGALLKEEYQTSIKYTKNHHKNRRIEDNLEKLDKKEDIRAEAWFTHRKRANLSEYGVGTVDQALLGVLNTPHQFVRLWGLGNRVVLLDEIHAYDTYTGTLINVLIAWLKALGSSVIIMSATFPEHKRRELLEAWSNTDTNQENQQAILSELSELSDYPRFTLVSGDGSIHSHSISSSREQDPITIREMGFEVSELANKALELVKQGGCVAVIVNTVQRAQDIFQAIREIYTEKISTVLSERGNLDDDLFLLLFHARYPADQRQKHEESVLKYLGKQDGKKEQIASEITRENFRPRHAIMISTQVAEQSLDFDVDVMITDLAPVDLILQRAGRLHRHKDNEKRRYAHTKPILWVAGLSEWPKEAMSSDGAKWKYIYSPYVMYRTWLALEDGQKIDLPQGLDDLVQKVYGAEDWYTLTEDQKNEVIDSEKSYNIKDKNERIEADDINVIKPDKLPLDINLDCSEDRDALTRLGTENIKIVPVYRTDSLYLCPKTRQVACLHDGYLRFEDAKVIFQRSIRVSRYELVQEAGQKLDDIELKAWRRNRLTYDCIPLILDEDGRSEAFLNIYLDDELGLVYN